MVRALLAERHEESPTVFAVRGLRPPPNNCLYDLTSDESEHSNVAAENPDILAKLQARFKALEQEYHPPKNNPPDDKGGYCAALARTRGYVAPGWAD